MFSSCVVYLPRESFNTGLGVAITINHNLFVARTGNFIIGPRHQHIATHLLMENIEI